MVYRCIRDFDEKMIRYIKSLSVIRKEFQSSIAVPDVGRNLYIGDFGCKNVSFSYTFEEGHTLLTNVSLEPT